MRRIVLYRTSLRDGERMPFWQPWGLGKWLFRGIIFLLILLLFILLFCLPRRDRFKTVIGDSPDSTFVTPDGDTLVGKNPCLFNPDIPRGVPGSGGGTPVDGSEGSQGGGADSGYPNPDNNRGVPGSGGGTPVDGSEGSQGGGADSGYPNPDNNRGVPGSGGGTPVDWPRNIRGGNPDPGLPVPDDNRIPPTDPDDIITDPRDGRQVDGRHLLVVLDSDAGDVTFNKFSHDMSACYTEDICRIVSYNTLTKLIILEVEPSMRELIKSELPSRIPELDFYVCDIEVLTQAAIVPDDPVFAYPDMSWFYSAVQAQEAWEITKGDRNVKVAVVDSYFELNHPDLSAANVVSPISIENGTAEVYPPSGIDQVSLVHGTHIAGTIFATMNNAEGISGIAPECSFIPVSLGRVMNTASLVEGILYAVYQGASVINASIGIAVSDNVARRLSKNDQVEIARTKDLPQEYLWEYVFKICRERNVTVVWASGNSDLLSAMDNSKRDSTTVKVDAIDRKLRKTEFSNYGNLPEYGFSNSTISAPGCQIMSTVPYGDYLPLDGTSMAAPIVTGAVALMKSLCPTLTNDEVIDILRSSSKPLHDDSIGDLLQIRSALDMIQGEFMQFDEIISDPQSIIGKWESTVLLGVTLNGEVTGEKVKIIMTFTSENEGIVEIVYAFGDRSGVVCSAPCAVSFADDGITITETEKPVSGQGDSFFKSVYRCSPDEAGLLKVKGYQENRTEVIDFYLRRID